MPEYYEYKNWEFMRIPLSGLKPHPKNAVIYGDVADDELIESIEKLDVLQPLVITFDKRIVSGHRRFDAYQRLGYTEVPCVEFPSRDETDILEALVMLNRQREKTSEQIAREAELLMGVERERAKERQGQRTDLLGDNIREHVPEGRARDIVGEKLGVSGRHIEKSIQVVERIDELRDEGETDKALELTETLNTSISRAHSQVKAMDIVEAEQKEPQLIIDMDDAKGLEKAVWDYTQKNSMAVRWRKFVGELLKMCIVRDSIIKDFNHGDFLEELKGMRRIQLSRSHESLMDVLDWLTNLIRDMEDANNG